MAAGAKPIHHPIFARIYARFGTAAEAKGVSAHRDELLAGPAGRVASLVLCSVEDPSAALAELYRVIRPGGELRFYEHVVSERPRLAGVQRLLDRTIWPHISGGCHASRDTLDANKAAGFAVEQCRSFEFRPAPAVPTAPLILGVARRP